MTEVTPEIVQDPETDQGMDRPRRRLRFVGFVPWIVVGLIFVTVLSPIIVASALPPLPLPPGQYPSVSVRFPDAPMSVSSPATIFEVSGNVVDIRVFGDTIERSRPMHVYAVANRPGEISLINVSP